MSRFDERTPYHHGDLRAALLDAARELVARNGAAQVSLRAIAREAGVSAAAPYHHFRDRETLLAGVAIDGFEGLRSAMLAGVGGSGGEDALARLQAAGEAYVRFATESPEVYRLMFSGLLSDRSRFPGLREAADAAFAVLLGLLGTGGTADADVGPGAEGAPADAGESARPRPGGGAAGMVPLAMWATVHGLALLLIEGILGEEAATVTPEEITREVTTVLGRGLKAFVGP